jgi:hypothetical protein
MMDSRSIHLMLFIFKEVLNMKEFNRKKIESIAIDKPYKAQIYVADSKNRSLIISTLIEMGFDTNMDYLLDAPTYYPFSVDTKEKSFMPIPTGIMACAAQCGARTLNFNELLDLIEEYENIIN